MKSKTLRGSPREATDEKEGKWKTTQSRRMKGCETHVKKLMRVSSGQKQVRKLMTARRHHFVQSCARLAGAAGGACGGAVSLQKQGKEKAVLGVSKTSKTTGETNVSTPTQFLKGTRAPPRKQQSRQLMTTCCPRNGKRLLIGAAKESRRERLGDDECRYEKQRHREAAGMHCLIAVAVVAVA